MKSKTDITPEVAERVAQLLKDSDKASALAIYVKSRGDTAAAKLLDGLAGELYDRAERLDEDWEAACWKE